SDPANTNDHPNRCASVTYPVASTNSAKRALVTAYASMRSDEISTSRRVSPSSGYANRPSLPIVHGPPRSEIIVSVAGSSRRGRDGAGGAATASRPLEGLQQRPPFTG